MPISLENEVRPGLPVVKRTTLGEVFVGAVVAVEQRDRQKKDNITGAMAPMLKPDGRPSQELVITCLTMPGTTSPVGLGDDQHFAAEAELVRVILKGKAFGNWIDGKKALGRPVRVGDVLTQKTEFAQAYTHEGQLIGDQITDQGALNNIPRGRSVGIYGSLTLQAPAAGSPWIAKAEEAYHELKAAKENFIVAETDLFSAGSSTSQASVMQQPVKPATISDAAWSEMDAATKAAVAKTMSDPWGGSDDSPPF